MKQVVLNLSQRRYGNNKNGHDTARSGKSVSARTPRTPRGKPATPRAKKGGTAVHQPGNTFEPNEADENIHKPAPTEFVS